MINIKNTAYDNTTCFGHVKYKNACTFLLCYIMSKSLVTHTFGH